MSSYKDRHLSDKLIFFLSVSDVRDEGTRRPLLLEQLMPYTCVSESALGAREMG